MSEEAIPEAPLVPKDFYCRLCLFALENNNFKELFSAFNTTQTVVQVVRAFAKIKILLEDEHSKLVCLGCFKKLTEFQNFKSLIQFSDLTLKNQLANKNSVSAERQSANSDCNDASDDEETESNDSPELKAKEKSLFLKKALISGVKIKNYSQLEGAPTKIKDEPGCLDDKSKVNQVFIKEEPDLSNGSDLNALQTGNVNDKPDLNKETALNVGQSEVRKVLKTKMKKFFKCLGCNKTFKTYKRRKAHSCQHSEVYPYNCTICQKGFGSQKTFLSHKADHNKVEHYKCEFCDKEFDISIAFHNHQRIHKDLISLKCQLCDLSFKSEFRLKTHFTVTHSENSINLGERSLENRKDDEMDESNASDDSDVEMCDLGDDGPESKLNLLPKKSVEVYEKQYNLFLDWCSKKKIRKYTENVLLAFFTQKAKNYKASTLWSTFSMLKATLIAKNNINIGKYQNLIAYLKAQNVGYEPKVPKVFTKSEVHKFLVEAPDDIYLMYKVCLIVGIAGACRRHELRQLNIDGIDDKTDKLIITIPESKAVTSRKFSVTDDIFDGFGAIEICRKYRSLRPIYCTHKTFFISYRKGKCSNQVVGVHTFGKIPSSIAKFLKLSDANDYTGHCFRRTSASLLGDLIPDVMNLDSRVLWGATMMAAQ